MRTVLRRGALAGAAGGLASAVLLAFLGEASIRDAIALEDAAARAAGKVPEPALVSRSFQVVGGSLAAVVYGVLVGVVFAVVYAAIRHRSRLRDDFGRSLGLATVGFVTIALVPALKYPPNPPAVGDPDTVNERTMAFLSLIAVAVALAYGAWWASRALRRRGLPDHLRVPLVGAGYAAVIGVLFVVWPANDDPITVPATLIWRFRVVSLAGMAALWSTLAVVHGWLWVREDAPEPEPALA